MRQIALTIAIAFLCAGHVRATTYDVEVPPKEGEKYKSAKFRIWIPDKLERVRALIVRQHGCGRNGIDHADDLQWQTLAKKHDCALVSSHFVQDKECSDWFDPKNGSRRAFEHALKVVDEKTKQNLGKLPMAIWGHSGGALWACHMTNAQPGKVVAVWARSGALTEFTEEALKVPIVFNYGKGEMTGRFEKVHQNSVKAFETYRAKFAPWAIAIDPLSEHDCKDSRSLAIIFFDEMLAIRLNPDNANLKAVPEASWRIDAKTKFVYAPTSSEGQPKEDYFAINEGFAKQFVEYTKNGIVKTEATPPAPTEINFKDGKLTWKADADMYSGIKFFHVYVNGKKVKSVGSPKEKGNKTGYFQIWNYGDEPEPRLPLMECELKLEPSDVIEITNENQAGTESKKSTALTIPKR